MAKRCLLTIGGYELTRALSAPAGRSERTVMVGDAWGHPMPVAGLRRGAVTSTGLPGDLIIGPAGGTLEADSDCAVLITRGPAAAAPRPQKAS